jgi:wyosine [tRNA(Phe)-imidazoG37] synthetase (radical SAM superfamily)
MEPTGPVRREHRAHPRNFADNRYVYAVLSRRSGGISIGVNLNPDKRCNFDCVYCQVDRRVMPPPAALDAAALADLKAELTAVLSDARAGRLTAHPRFADLPETLRDLKDVALSGDGEPTSVPAFGQAVDAVLEAIEATGWKGLPVVLITNASGLDRPDVIAAVDRIVAAGGDMWAKLDAGTPEYFARVCSTRVPFTRILDNLQAAARRHPLTIQTCLMTLEGAPPPEAEVAAYVERVGEIAGRGGALRAVQLYTVARPPAEAVVGALPEAALEAVAERLRARVPGLAVGVYP